MEDFISITIILPSLPLFESVYPVALVSKLAVVMVHDAVAVPLGVGPVTGVHEHSVVWLVCVHVVLVVLAAFAFSFAFFEGATEENAADGVVLGPNTMVRIIFPLPIIHFSPMYIILNPPPLLLIILILTLIRQPPFLPVQTCAVLLLDHFASPATFSLLSNIERTHITT